MTNEQKAIERQEFGCADGKQVLKKVYEALGAQVRVRDAGWTAESDAMMHAVGDARRALAAAEHALSAAYDAVGVWAVYAEFPVEPPMEGR